MFVIDVDVDLLANASANVELNRACIPHEVRGYVNLDSLAMHDAVRGEVLAFEMHVDRHVKFGASSTNRWDEVDCGYAAPLLYERYGVRCKEEFHWFSNPG